MINIRMKQTPLLCLLERNYGVSLEKDIVHLTHVSEHYSFKERMILEQYGYAAYDMNEYKKIHLISEAAKIILREIAPKRRKKNVK